MKTPKRAGCIDWVGRLGEAFLPATAMRAFGLAVILTTALAWYAQATTYYVDEMYGNNHYDGLSASLFDGHGPKLNVSAAIAAASDGASVVLNNGFYGEEAWNPGAKSLTLNPQDSVNVCDIDLCWADSIGDGIPDWWRLFFFDGPLATNSNTCAWCEPYGDGLTNLQRYQGVVPETNLPIMAERLDWLGGGGLSFPACNCLQFDGNNILVRLGASWARAPFGYDGSNTNNDTLAWRAVQTTSSNQWDWTKADDFMSFVTTALPPFKLVVQLDQSNDPDWASQLVLASNNTAYAAAKGAYIQALAARYGDGGTFFGTNSSWLWGIEIENEPHPWITYTGTTNVFWGDGSYTNYDRHISILQAAQPARAYTRLVGWACQGPSVGVPGAWFTYLLTNSTASISNLVDAISWHYYNNTNFPPDVGIGQLPANTWWTGRLDRCIAEIRSEMGNPDLPILIDEFGVGNLDTSAPPAPPQMVSQETRALILARVANTDFIQFHVWGFCTSGNLCAFENFFGNDSTNHPWPAARALAWTAYWLGNATNTAMTVNSNAFVTAWSNDRTLAWTLNGTTRGYTSSGFTNITNIYGIPINPGTLTENVTIFQGNGSITLFP